jgi:hypothetical protein
MGAGNYNRQVKYYNIVKGKFVHKDKDGVKHEFDFINGVLTAVKIANEEFEGRPYKLVWLNLYDGKENSIVSFSFNSGYGRAFCKQWENAQLLEPMELSASYKKEEGKPAVTSLFILQNNKALKWYYTKDNPKDLPQGVKNPDTGKWDFSDQEKYLLEKLELLSNELSDIMSDPATKTVMVEAGEQPMKPSEKSDVFIDDLPF